MIPEALKERTQWLVWRLENKLGQAKPAKMPYYASGPRMGSRRTGVQGSEEDRTCLTTFEHALEYKSRHGYTGVGFAFLKGDGLIGIDLDKCIEDFTDTDSGEIVPRPTERAQKIIGACASFTEYSPSGKGVHIYCLGTSETFKSNDIGVEVFCGSQFFTVTGEHMPGTPPRVNAASPLVLEMLRGFVDQAKGKDVMAKPRASAPATPQTEDKRAKVESALLALSPECGYEEWLQIGMSIHAALGDAGFAVWDYWSSKSTKYPKAKAMESHWKSFHPGPITEATLFGLAMKAGWKPPRMHAPRAPAESRDSPPLRSPEGGDVQGAGGDGGDGGDGGPPPDVDHFTGEYDPEGLPIVQVTAGHLPETADQAEDVLLDGNVPIYQRDRMLVRVVRRSVPAVRNYKRAAGTLGIVTVELPFLVDVLTRAAHWQRWDPRGVTKGKDGEDEKGKWVRINCPDKVAATVMARAGHWKLPELWSVITAPTLRPDGTILQEPGYDAAMKAMYDPCGVDFPRIPDSPTKADAEVALAKLQKAFSTLPFVDLLDQSVAISFALCALVRRSLASAPLGAITATMMASGKTLIADVVNILVAGTRAPAMTYIEQEEEFKKTLLAVLMEGDPVVLIDNVSHPLTGDTLCSMLTSETYSQRMLGRTEMVKVQTTTLILANGNNMVIAGDLRTRALLARLDPQTERPEEREFKTELKEFFIQRRAELVAAGLTVLRAWQIADEKKNGVVKPFGRFEQWSDMVRSPLVWLGMPDPCESIKELERDDPERAELRQVLHAWYQLLGAKPQRASDVCTLLGQAAAPDEIALEVALRDFAKDRDGRYNAKRLGNWLRKRAGRRMGELMLSKADQEKDHAVLWIVDKVPA